MRVTGGVHRGRRLAACGGRDVRPTTTSASRPVPHPGPWRFLGASRIGRCRTWRGAGRSASYRRGGVDALLQGRRRPWRWRRLSRGAASAVLHGRRTARYAGGGAPMLTALGRVLGSRSVLADATRPPPPRGPAAALAFLDRPTAATSRAGHLALDRGRLAGAGAFAGLVVETSQRRRALFPRRLGTRRTDRRWRATAPPPCCGVRRRDLTDLPSPIIRRRRSPVSAPVTTLARRKQD